MKTVKLSDVRPGSVVIVQTWGEGAKQVTVEEVEKDIKNGFPGITYSESWAYLDQIIRVVQF